MDKLQRKQAVNSARTSRPFIRFGLSCHAVLLIKILADAPAAKYTKALSSWQCCPLNSWPMRTCCKVPQSFPEMHYCSSNSWPTHLLQGNPVLSCHAVLSCSAAARQGPADKPDGLTTVTPHPPWPCTAPVTFAVKGTKTLGQLPFTGMPCVRTVGSGLHMPSSTTAAVPTPPPSS